MQQTQNQNKTKTYTGYFNSGSPPNPNGYYNVMYISTLFLRYSNSMKLKCKSNKHTQIDAFKINAIQFNGLMQ